eukprot:15455966-Alexandrium_andersonii.AAC.1
MCASLSPAARRKARPASSRCSRPSVASASAWALPWPKGRGATRPAEGVPTACALMPVAATAH